MEIIQALSYVRTSRNTLTQSTMSAPIETTGVSNVNTSFKFVVEAFAPGTKAHADRLGVSVEYVQSEVGNLNWLFTPSANTTVAFITKDRQYRLTINIPVMISDIEGVKTFGVRLTAAHRLTG